MWTTRGPAVGGQDALAGLVATADNRFSPVQSVGTIWKRSAPAPCNHPRPSPRPVAVAQGQSELLDEIIVEAALDGECPGAVAQYGMLPAIQVCAVCHRSKMLLL